MFIRENADRRAGGLRWGVEPICAVLTCELGVRIAPSCFYERLKRQPSARQRRDEQLKAENTRVHP